MISPPDGEDGRGAGPCDEVEIWLTSLIISVKFRESSSSCLLFSSASLYLEFRYQHHDPTRRNWERDCLHLFTLLVSGDSTRHRSATVGGESSDLVLVMSNHSFELFLLVVYIVQSLVGRRLTLLSLDHLAVEIGDLIHRVSSWGRKGISRSSCRLDVPEIRS